MALTRTGPERPLMTVVPRAQAALPDAPAGIPAAVPTLEGLFRRHVHDVCRIIAHLLGPAASRADVDDLCQQVFLAVHKALPRFRGDSAVSTWIYGITSRVVMQHLRGWRRYRAMIQRFEALPLSPPAGVEESVEQREALLLVWRVLLRMKPEMRVVFVLAEVESLSAREIGEALELGEEAVRSRLRRARAELERGLANVRARESKGAAHE